MNSTAKEIRARNLRTIGALSALFLVPLVVSFVLYYATDWRPAGSTSHGDLILPPRPLPNLSSDLVRPTGGAKGPAIANLFADKWSLVYIGTGECATACRRALLVMRQTRLSLNNEMTRVQRVFLANSPCCDDEFLSREHVGLMVIDANAPPFQALLSRFPPDNREYSLFIVDPLGNLMMRYDARQNPKGLLDDLKKLLKLSHIG